MYGLLLMMMLMRVVLYCYKGKSFRDFSTFIFERVMLT